MPRRASTTKKAPKKSTKKRAKSARPAPSRAKARSAPEPAPAKKTGDRRKRLEVGPSEAEVVESTLQRAIDDKIEHSELVKITDASDALDDPGAVVIAKHGQLYRIKRSAAPRAKSGKRERE